MQYTTHRRSKRDFWRSRNTKFYLAVFLIFIVFFTVIIITIKKKDTPSTDITTTDDYNNVTDGNIEQPTSTPVKAGIYEIRINLSNCVIFVIDSNMNRVIRMIPAAISDTIKEGMYNTEEGTSTRSTWVSAGDTAYYRYYTNFGNDISFHSSRYKEQHNKNSLVTTDYNQIGTITDLEGITLKVEDAKWIYENCSSDSYISVVNTESHAIPDYFKIPENMSWDPSDVSEGSPWCTTKIDKLDAPKSIELNEGDTANSIMTYIKATDTDGADISSYVQIIGIYDIKRPGIYNIKAQITDIYGNISMADIALTIIPKETESETEEESETESETEDVLEEVTAESESSLEGVTEETTTEESVGETTEETSYETPTTENIYESVTDIETETTLDAIQETSQEVTQESKEELETTAEEITEPETTTNEINETQPESESPAELL